MQITSRIRLGMTRFTRGDYRGAIDLLRQTVALVPHDRVNEYFGMVGPAYTMARHWLALSLGDCGAFAEAISLAEEVSRVAQGVENPFTVSAGCWSHGHALLVKGDLDRAIPILERGVALCRDGGFQIQVVLIGTELGYAYALPGRHAEAIPLLEELVGLEPVEKLRLREAAHHMALANAYAMAGRHAGAAEQATVALGVARKLHERSSEADALRLLGDLGARPDEANLDAAEGYYREALASSSAIFGGGERTAS